MAIPSVTTLTACGLGSCWQASQAFADASTLHSATCDATRHLLSGVRCGQWIMRPPPSPRRHSCLRPRVALDFRSPNQATPSRMTRSTCCCNRCWNFLAVVRLVAPNRMCLVDYRQMGQNLMAVNRKRCRTCYQMVFRSNIMSSVKVGKDLLVIQRRTTCETGKFSSRKPTLAINRLSYWFVLAFKHNRLSSI